MSSPPKTANPTYPPKSNLAFTHTWASIVRENNATAIIINGIQDHVHLLVILPPTLPLSKLISAIKANSSKWLKQEWRNLNTFAWQEGYGAFSVSQSALSTVKQYIATQEEHHRTRTFQDEFIALLKLHNIAYDEQYLW